MNLTQNFTLKLSLRVVRLTWDFLLFWISLIAHTDNSHSSVCFRGWICNFFLHEFDVFLYFIISVITYACGGKPLHRWYLKSVKFLFINPPPIKLKWRTSICLVKCRFCGRGLESKFYQTNPKFHPKTRKRTVRDLQVKLYYKLVMLQSVMHIFDVS